LIDVTAIQVNMEESINFSNNNDEGCKLQKLAEGKTKIIMRAPDNPFEVIIASKDSITAGDGAKVRLYYYS
jgi:hypothetical protein